jgi:gliding motility-associated-like protein
MQVGVYTGLYIPKAFTPNGDGKNDKWDIPGLAMYPDAEVFVFDRAGQIMYRNKGNYISKPFDGKLKGQPLPGAVYVYIIYLNDVDKRVVKGVVTIVY